MHFLGAFVFLYNHCNSNKLYIKRASKSIFLVKDAEANGYGAQKALTRLDSILWLAGFLQKEENMLVYFLFILSSNFHKFNTYVKARTRV